MLNNRIEEKWIDAFTQVFQLSAVAAGDEVVILSETQSRQINVHLAELALLRLNARPGHLQIPTPRQNAPVRGCTIRLDDKIVVEKGKVVSNED